MLSAEGAELGPEEGGCGVGGAALLERFEPVQASLGLEATPAGSAEAGGDAHRHTTREERGTERPHTA